MYTSTRPSAATLPLATGMLAVVTALIALVVSLVDDLGTPAFLVLLAAELLVVLVMAVLLAGLPAGNAVAGGGAAVPERDLETLDALEPLRADESNGWRR